MGFDLFMGWDWSGLKGNERKGIGGLDIPHGERNVHGELKEVFDWLLLLFLWHA